MKDHHKMRIWCIEEKMYAKRIMRIFSPQECVADEELIELELPVEEEPYLTCGFDNVIFELCTGLRDKNGVLVHEGDRLACRYGGPYSFDSSEGTVKLLDGCWSVEFDKMLKRPGSNKQYAKQDYLKMFHPVLHGEIEVIGNIHQKT